MKRQSNIELLRIFAILGVVFLHYYNGEMGGASALVEHKGEGADRLTEVIDNGS